MVKYLAGSTGALRNEKKGLKSTKFGAESADFQTFHITRHALKL